MKLIVDKGSNGLTTKEFREYLKTPVLKSEITQNEADELRMKLSEALIENPGLGISATQIGIKNHLVKRLNMREQIIKLVENYNLPKIFFLLDCKNLRVSLLIICSDIFFKFFGAHFNRALVC